jgi:4-hydroxy-tetrahydrodipicolinate synthase
MNGIWLPLITPFKDDEFDETSLVALLHRYLASPIDGLILAATTGEALTLEADETKRLASITAQIVAGRIPVFLGMSGSNTRHMRRRLVEMRNWPIDGYLITCPYYTRPSQEGLRQHFTSLAETTDKPVAVYNIPYRTGVNMSNETLLRLAELENVIGVKDCCANHAQTFDLLRARPPGFSVMTGEDALFYSALAHGADGGILASAHVDPWGFAAVRSDFLAGRSSDALQRWNTLSDAVSLLFSEPSPGPIKHWLCHEGWIASPEMRLPMAPISDPLAARIRTYADRHPVRDAMTHALG